MKTVAQVLTLPQFLAWARTKPQDEEFNYCSNNGCSIAQYLKAQGHEDVTVYGWDYRIGNTYHDIPEDIMQPMGRLLRSEGSTRTFGKLVDVLEDELVAGYDKAMASAESLTLSDM